MRHLSRFPVVLLAVPALGLARLLPAEGLGLALRLGAATLCLLVPGDARRPRAAYAGPRAPVVAFSLARSPPRSRSWSSSTCRSRWRSRSSSASPSSPSRSPSGAALPRCRPGAWSCWALGVAFGVAIWHVAAPIEGDALFHLARVRKLSVFDDLSLDSVSEFRDGGLHPGYAFPLWHAFLALVARLAGVDPSLVVLHEASVLAPLAFARRLRGGRGALPVALDRVRTRPRAGRADRALAGEGRRLRVPRAAGDREPPAARPRRARPRLRASRGAAPGVAGRDRRGRPRAGDRPPDVRGLPLPADRRLPRWRGRCSRTPTTSRSQPRWSRSPSRASPLRSRSSRSSRRRRRTRRPGPSCGVRFDHYAGQIDVFSATSYRLAPEVFGRSGAVAVAALLLIPLAALAVATPLGGVRARRLDRGLRGHARALRLSAASPTWSRCRRRGAWPGSCPSPSRSRAAWRSWRRSSARLCCRSRSAAGLLLQAAYPGDFGYTFRGGGPALASWIAALGGAAALVAAPFIRRVVEPLERRG